MWKEKGADPFLPKAQMKTNKFKLCLHLLRNEMHHVLLKKKHKTKQKTNNFEETNCADSLDIEPPQRKVVT